MASNTALPASTCSRFLRLAISIILGERSIAVIVPVVSLSQTRETATPWPADLEQAVGRADLQGVDRPDEPLRCLARHARAIASRAREAQADLLEKRSVSCCCSFARRR